MSAQGPDNFQTVSRQCPDKVQKGCKQIMIKCTPKENRMDQKNQAVETGSVKLAADWILDIHICESAAGCEVGSRLDIRYSKNYLSGIFLYFVLAMSGPCPDSFLTLSVCLTVWNLFKFCLHRECKPSDLLCV